MKSERLIESRRVNMILPKMQYLYFHRPNDFIFIQNPNHKDLLAYDKENMFLKFYYEVYPTNYFKKVIL